MRLQRVFLLSRHEYRQKKYHSHSFYNRFQNPRSLSFQTLLHCFSMHSSVRAVTLTFLVAVSWAKTPQVVRWNTTDYYGPDGPWQVRLQFGS